MSAWLHGTRSFQAQLRRSADKALTGTIATFHEVDDLLSRLPQQPADACSPRHVEAMLSVDVGSPNIDGIGYFENGLLKCSSWQGFSPPLRRLPADIATLDGIQITTPITLAISPLTALTGIHRGDYIAVMNTSRIQDNVDAGAQVLIRPTGTSYALMRTSGFRNDAVAQDARTGKRSLATSQVVVHRDGLETIAYRSGPSPHHLLTAHPYLTPIIALATLLPAYFLALRTAREGHSMRSRIRRALRDDEMHVLFQPIVRLADGRCIGAEVLARWTDSSGASVPPDIFIPIAEETGQIRELTRVVMSKALDALQLLLRSHPDFHVAFNLSAPEMQDGEFLSVLTAMLQRHGIPPAQVVLEVTEHGFLAIDSARETINNARDEGFLIAIDDFGTGYSNLSNLQSLPLDMLKLDRSFLTDIEAEQQASIVHHVINMAHAMSLSIIAEGVEDNGQAESLRGLGVQYAQGWLYSKAITAEALREFVESNQSAPADPRGGSTTGNPPTAAIEDG